MTPRTITTACITPTHLLGLDKLLQSIDRVGWKVDQRGVSRK